MFQVWSYNDGLGQAVPGYIPPQGAPGTTTSLSYDPSKGTFLWGEKGYIFTPAQSGNAAPVPYTSPDYVPAKATAQQVFNQATPIPASGGTVSQLPQPLPLSPDYVQKYTSTFGRPPNVTRVSTGTYYPEGVMPILTQEQRERAAAISRSKGINITADQCASIDAVTGECAASRTPGPFEVFMQPGLGPANPPITPTTAPATCPPGQRIAGWTQSVPPHPICEPVTQPVIQPTGTERGSVVVDYYFPPSQSGQAELCPIQGFVTRGVPGAPEYQVFRCDPGQPVSIDIGLQTVGARDAYGRLQPVTAAATQAAAKPNWPLIGGLALGAYLLLGKKGRR